MMGSDEKKNKMISLRISEMDFNIINEFAASQGLTINAFINSVIKSQVEWFIPNHSYENVSLPKSLLSSLFSIADKNELDDLAKTWTMEVKNSIQLFEGETNEITTKSLMNFYHRVTKYLIGSNIRKKEDLKDDNKVSIMIRHSLGENFSYFCYQTSILLNEILKNIKISGNYFSNTVSFTITDEKKVDFYQSQFNFPSNIQYNNHKANHIAAANI